MTEETSEEKNGEARVSSEPCKPTTSACARPAHFVRGVALVPPHYFCARCHKTCTNFERKPTIPALDPERKIGTNKFISK